MVQTAVIIGMSAFLGAGLPGPIGLAVVVAIVLLLVLGVTALSLGLAFALPGHIELIAVIFVTNLPLLFASTALAPLSFMPTWLQVVASLNPLSYAIESIRHIYTHSHWLLSDIVMQAPFANITMATALLVLFGFSSVVLLSIRPLLRRSFA